MEPSTPIKVFIRNLAGEYLCGEGEAWEFHPSPEQAHVFDYHADEVVAQLEQAERELGVVWIASPADPDLIADRCESCGQRMTSREAHFDGERCLCPRCRMAKC